VKNSNEGEDIVRKPTTFSSAIALGVAGAISAATPSLADPITYTLQFIGTGSLGTSSFTDAQVTLQFVGDTSDITPVPGFGYVNGQDTGTASVSVAGVNGGAFVMFTDTIVVLSNPVADLGPGTVGFLDLSSPTDIVDDTNTAVFADYALGPIGATVGGTLALGDSGASYPIEGGDFSLTGVRYNDPNNFPDSPTFTATVAVPAPPIGRGLPMALAVGSLLLYARLPKRRRGR
jgi:hypothetical protein